MFTCAIPNPRYADLSADARGKKADERERRNKK